ncbi:Pilus biogenesis CpaD protein [Methyloligella halotolerans]|uniref:Pilus biogenesis CpaD protein n=1 Tax=Methyloligella halotolerans TaxID=1177755 RepID=A0A1E2RWE9_9HYPH|nr:CpaD family pilus assembly protein [Methyloligella halotolerans]ODA66389.1 Pilus biogenesis CpaD protein [Methyloligella halotolerans]
MSGFPKLPSEPVASARSAAALLAVLLSSAALTGCMNAGPRFEAPFMLSNPNERHPILVSNAEARLDIPVYAGSYGMTSSQESQLNSYLADFRRNKGSQLVINAPVGGDERATRAVFTDVKRALRRYGFTENSVVLQSYSPGYKSTRAIRLTYERFVAKGPTCPDWSENLAWDPNNQPYPNMGCATQRNLAAQVANPRDLVQPADQTPRSSERRDTVWGKYIAGEVTGADWTPEPLPERTNSMDSGGGN